MRPFLVRMNDRGGGVDDLMPRADDHARGRDGEQSDAAVGGGSGGADPGVPAGGRPGTVNGASIPAGWMSNQRATQSGTDSMSRLRR